MKQREGMEVISSEKRNSQMVKDVYSLRIRQSHRHYFCLHHQKRREQSINIIKVDGLEREIDQISL